MHPGDPKDDNNWFGEPDARPRGHVQKSRHHRNESFLRFKSTNYYTKSNKNNSTEFLSLLFPQTYHKHNREIIDFLNVCPIIS